MTGDKPLTIGALARAAGVHVETVRYYQRRGLIAQPRKPARGHRIYPRETLERLLFIKRAQELGFTLEEIASLLVLGGETRCGKWRNTSSPLYVARSPTCDAWKKYWTICSPGAATTPTSATAPSSNPCCRRMLTNSA